ncbi:MAG TPA: S1 RNA-binding domain-containing protein, partial [Magnetospirillum sp.]|nr:S1 RNA-binding domain-containing protein [Magnetospirillum sp.]
NVTNFGAFVDIGVHQDGLVHVSLLANRFVKDPHEVVKPGDVVNVKVLEVDLKRKRIGLSMRMDETPAPRSDRSGPPSGGRPAPAKAAPKAQSTPFAGGALADAFARAKKKG